MSKFWKILGIGTALGTVIYGVVKYREDQKFKEAVDETCEKVAETAKEAATKTVMFVLEHPVATGVVCGAAGVLIHEARKSKARAELQADIDIAIAEAQSDAIQQEARRQAELRMQYEDICANPQDYYIIRKDDYERLAEENAE